MGRGAAPAIGQAQGFVYGAFSAMVEAVRMPGDEAVVCGDFTVRPGSETLAIPSARLGMAGLVVPRAGGDAPVVIRQA